MRKFTKKSWIAMLALAGLVAGAGAIVIWQYLSDEHVAPLALLTKGLGQHAHAKPLAVFPMLERPGWHQHAKPTLFSPDGHWLFMEGPDRRQNELIHLPSGPRVTLDGERPDLRAFSPDGKFFVGQQDNHWCLWTLDDEPKKRTLRWIFRRFETNKEERVIHIISDNSNSVHFSLDSKMIATVWRTDTYDFPCFYFWDADTAKLYSSIRPSEICGEIGTGSRFYHCSRMAWGFDSCFLVEKSRTNNNGNEARSERICCWDVRTSKVRFEIENVATSSYFGSTWRVAPDGKRVVVIVNQAERRAALPDPGLLNSKEEICVPIDPMVQVWDVVAGKMLWQRPFPPDHAVFHLSITPDGRKVAISSRDLSRNNRVELQMWNIEDGAAKTLIEMEPKGRGAAFVLTAGGNCLEYHDPPWVGNTPWPEGPESRTVAGWWEIKDGRAQPRISFDDDGNWHDRDGRKHELFSASEKTTKRVAGQRRANLNSMSAAGCIAAPGLVANLSPDERWLAMRLTFLQPIIQPLRPGSNRQEDSWNEELHLVDLQDGSKASIIHGVKHWLFAPDGKTLATTGDGNLRIWALPGER